MKRNARRPKANPIGAILAPPAPEEIIRLLRAWRFWFLGGLVGALLGAAAYAAAPPPYRARATVNVDFHLEQAWPQNTDREHFYYLERETRKLIEVAVSDETLGMVANSVPDLTVDELRDHVLRLSQPGSGGWHFFADSRDPATASLLATAWARAFCAEVARMIAAGPAGGLEPFITADLVQEASPLPGRAHGMGLHMIVGAGVVMALGAFGILLVRFRQ